jgi:hypothetical protein
MKDEEWLFVSDVVDKKNVARSARSRRTHNGKSGRVKFPSDYMTKKEKEAMSGEVKSYRLNDPMTWKEFKAMPDDIKITYIKLLRQKYGVNDTDIGKMLGVVQNGIAREVKRLGISLGRGGYNRAWDKEGWLAWVNGAPADSVEESFKEDAENGLESIEDTEEHVPAVIPKERTFCVHRAIPNCGNMVFEGNVEAVVNALSAILGGANVHISITWDVLDE